MNVFTPAALTLSDRLSKYCQDASKPVDVADIRRLALVIANTHGANKAFIELVKGIKAERARLVGSVEIPS